MIKSSVRSELTFVREPEPDRGRQPTRRPTTRTGLGCGHCRAAFLIAATGLGVLLAGTVVAQETNAVPPSRFDPVTVVGQNFGYHNVTSEADRVGPYGQPEWTARRAFAETDIYVIPPGEVEFNQFYISSHPRHAKPENLFESEFEFGLPWRTQFDVELNYSLNSGVGRYDSTLIEVPHALADWGKLPLNPTLDAGWRFNTDTDDAWFVRLLLAEELSQRVHLGANLAFERQISGELETTYELNLAVNYTAIDSKLAIGAELLVEHELARESELDADGEWETETERATTVMLGPTLLYRPSRSMYLGLVPLFGLTQDAPVVDAFVIFGMDFEPFAHGAATAASGLGPDQLRPVRRPR